MNRLMVINYDYKLIEILNKMSIIYIISTAFNSKIVYLNDIAIY